LSPNNKGIISNDVEKTLKRRGASLVSLIENVYRKMGVLIIEIKLNY